MQINPRHNVLQGMVFLNAWVLEGLVATIPWRELSDLSFAGILKTEGDRLYNYCIVIFLFFKVYCYSSSLAEGDTARTEQPRACLLAPSPLVLSPLVARGFDTWHELPQASLKTWGENSVSWDPMLDVTIRKDVLYHVCSRRSVDVACDEVLTKLPQPTRTASR